MDLSKFEEMFVLEVAWWSYASDEPINAMYVVAGAVQKCKHLGIEHVADYGWPNKRLVERFRDQHPLPYLFFDLDERDPQKDVVRLTPAGWEFIQTRSPRFIAEAERFESLRAEAEKISSEMEEGRNSIIQIANRVDIARWVAVGAAIVSAGAAVAAALSRAK